MHINNLILSVAFSFFLVLVLPVQAKLFNFSSSDINSYNNTLEISYIYSSIPALYNSKIPALYNSKITSVEHDTATDILEIQRRFQNKIILLEKASGYTSSETWNERSKRLFEEKKLTLEDLENIMNAVYDMHEDLIRQRKKTNSSSQTPEINEKPQKYRRNFKSIAAEISRTVFDETVAHVKDTAMEGMIIFVSIQLGIPLKGPKPKKIQCRLESYQPSEKEKSRAVFFKYLSNKPILNLPEKGYLVFDKFEIFDSLISTLGNERESLVLTLLDSSEGNHSDIVFKKVLVCGGLSPNEILEKDISQ